jgi:CubicO group peptidase (beta-lactamase class C family)
MPDQLAAAAGLGDRNCASKCSRPLVLEVAQQRGIPVSFRHGFARIAAAAMADLPRRTVVTFALAASVCRPGYAFDAARADATVRRAMHDHSISALAIGVSHAGRPNYVHGYGARVSANAIFAIGSITKAFTTVAMLQLAERRRLVLDASVCRYAPEYPAWCAVTLRDLLAQRSGIPDVAQMAWFDRFAAAPISTEELLGRVASLPLNFAPGDRYEYSNSNFVLAALIAARASGMPYIVWLHRDVLDPLDLRATHVAWPFLPGGRVRASLPLGSPTLAFGSADLQSNVPDLLTWGTALMPGGQFERDGTLMTRETLGVETGRIDAREAAWSSGYVAGFSAFFALLPRERLAVVVLANADRVDLSPLATSLVRIALGEPD